ncbi:MAG: polysaccharide deacetylase family protein [Planctomycetaceae bacterium]
MRVGCVGLIVLTAVCLGNRPVVALEPIPDKLVVLTFDDSVRSHYTVVRQILLDYGFGATFFITEGFDFPTNKQDYMTWEQIAELHRDGFEIGNHSRDHQGMSEKAVPEYAEQLEAINRRCEAHGIPRTACFAYPGNAFHPSGFETLREAGIVFARRGGAPEYPYDHGRGFAYEPGRDHPLLIPSAGDARPDWTMADFLRAVQQAQDGRIAVLQFHGIPDLQHPWVHTPEDQFRAFMKYLSLNDYQVIALRDLKRFVDPSVVPDSFDAVIAERKKRVAEGD